MSILCAELKLQWEMKYCNTFVQAMPSIVPAIGIKDKWKLNPSVLYGKYTEYAEEIYNFKVRPDDVWIVTFPKSGTTWTQSMVWMLCNNLDYSTESKLKLTKRYAFLESHIIVDNVASTVMDISNEYASTSSSLQKADRMASPRFIKTHLPAQLLPKDLWTVKPKMIYTARNPKDTAISYYYHYRNLRDYTGTFKDFMKFFITNQLPYTPFHSHVLNFWNMRHEENILFLTYEGMKSDLLATINQTAKFLNRSYSELEMERLEKHLNIDAMRDNLSNNCEFVVDDLLKAMNATKLDEDFKFIRRGVAGGFHVEMTPELIEEFDNWSRKELKDTDFQFAM